MWPKVLRKEPKRLPQLGTLGHLQLSLINLSAKSKIIKISNIHILNLIYKIIIKLIVIKSKYSTTYIKLNVVNNYKGLPIKSKYSKVDNNFKIKLIILKLVLH